MFLGDGRTFSRPAAVLLFFLLALPLAGGSVEERAETLRLKRENAAMTQRLQESETEIKRLREELLAVKLGQRPWADIERDITEGLERLSRLQADSPFGAPLEEGSAARAARRVILHCYGLEEKHDC